MSEAAKQNRIQATSKLYANTLLAETDTVPVIVEPHALFYGEMIVCAVAYCKNKNLIELMKHLAKIYDCKEDEFYAVAILLGVSLRSTEVRNYDTWCSVALTCVYQVVCSYTRLP